MLLDADALNALAAWGPDSWVPRAREMRAAGRPGGLVLTPHAGELSRLTGRPVEHLTADPVARVREWASRWGATLVFKGAPSVVAAPESEVWVNPTGNSGLATGGSGDVLSGIIGALLGQGLAGSEAAVLGCYLHGLAADLAVAGTARRSLLPGDLPEHLGAAIASIERGAEPPGWRWRMV
jgi:NAD(P)H-hydrate epimerase